MVVRTSTPGDPIPKRPFLARVFIFHTPNRKGLLGADAKLIPKALEKNNPPGTGQKEEDFRFLPRQQPEEIARVAETTGSR
jgi:hypothetical protein